MKIKFKGNCLNEEWNADLTKDKVYKVFNDCKPDSYIIDDVSEKVHIGDFRLSKFEIVGGNE